MKSTQNQGGRRPRQPRKKEEKTTTHQVNGMTITICREDEDLLTKPLYASIRGAGDTPYVQFVEAAEGGKRVHRSLAAVILARLHPEARAAQHLNGNRLDFRRSNLAPSTPGKIAAASRLAGNKPHGVYFNSFKQRFIARIKVNGKSKYIGSYVDQSAAIQAYDEAAKKYHGANALLNNP